MSYTTPNNGIYRRTEAPSNTSSCTGNFAQKLNCQEHGNLVWVGAMCAVVAFLFFCSCCVLPPLKGLCLKAKGKLQSPPPPDSAAAKITVPKENPHARTHETERAVEWKPQKNRTAFTSNSKKEHSTPYRHTYPHSTALVSDGNLERGRVKGSSSTRDSRTHSTRNTDKHGRVVEDPGIGSQATAKGGGWMGAANGRIS